MLREFRVDAGEALRAPVKTPGGFLRIDGFAARPGVYEYRMDDGRVIRELRPDDEVYRQDSLGGYEGAPLTNHHPTALVDTSNVKAYEVGSVTAPGRREGDRVATSMVVKDNRTIGQVLSGELAELSPGYTVRIDARSGVDPKYGPYDQIQRDISINHLALVPKARGGADMRVRLDGAAAARAGMRFGVAVRSDASPDKSSARADCSCEQVFVTDEALGHQHTIDASPRPWDDGRAPTSGKTSTGNAKGADSGHDHDWIRSPDGSVQILENAGHSHKVVPMPGSAMTAGRADTASSGSSAAPPRPQGAQMDPQEQIRQLTTQLSEARREIDTLKTTATDATARADAADAKSTQLERRVGELAAQLETGIRQVETEAVQAQAQRADAAEEKIRGFESRFDGAVNTRVDIIRKAWVVMGPEFNPGKELSNRAIQEMAIRRMDAKADVTDKMSDAAVAGTFDALVQLRGQAAISYQTIGEAARRAAAAPPGARADDNGAAARQEAHRHQWKQGLTNLPPRGQARNGSR